MPNEDLEIRPNKKLCTCLKCGGQVPKGFQMLHIDRWGSRCTICLRCVKELGWQAGVAERAENLRRKGEL